MIVIKTIGVPVMESVSFVRMGVGIPYRLLIFYIFLWMLRIIGCREIQVVFTEIGTLITCPGKHITDGFDLRRQAAHRTCRIAIERHTAPVRIHSGHQHAPVGTAERTIALSRGQHQRLPGKPVEIRSMYGISLKGHVFPEIFLAPESHGMVAKLAGKHIDHMGQIRRGVPCTAVTAIQGPQTYNAQ